MVKKGFLSMASFFLIWQSYKLLHGIDHFETASFWLLIFIAWIINLFITGVFAFAGFAFPTQQLMPKAYYVIYKPNTLKRVFRMLRVDLFRRLLLATLWKSQVQRKKYFDGKKRGISNLEVQSMKSEFGHLIPFIIICFVSFYLLAIGLVKLSVLCLLINLIGNLYPVLLQRHHRMRIQLLKKRITID